jgi:hypothetical protein
MMQSEPLLASTFLFRFSVPCLYRKDVWSGGVQLDEKHRLPTFGELEGRPLWADVRGAWSEEGFTFRVQVAGKRQALWCRDARPDDSDGFQLWIDTRNTKDIHRASRFCHRFAFLPAGGGKRLAEPVAAWLPINRAKEHPKTFPPGTLAVRSELQAGGYILAAHIPSAALTGFDPDEHPRIGFSYAVIDREHGWQTFTVGPEFPFVEDPSLWGELELKK